MHSLIDFDQIANAPGGTDIVMLLDQHQHDVSQEFQLNGDTLGEREQAGKGIAATAYRPSAHARRTRVR